MTVPREGNPKPLEARAHATSASERAQSPLPDDAALVRAALERDGERVLPIVAPCFAFLLGAEAISHATEWPALVAVYPAVSFLVMGLFSWIVRTGRTRLRPIWAWLLVPWLISFVGVSIHVPRDPDLSLIFMTIGVLCAGVLNLPTVAIAISLPLTTAAQIYCALTVHSDRPTSAILIPLATFGIAILMHLARRAAIVSGERQRALEDSLRRQQEKLDRLEREQERARLEAALHDETRALEASRRVLTEQKKLAEVGILAAGIAHQINNPLGAILSSADFALYVEDAVDGDSASASALAEIRRQAIRCGRIVRSVLQLSRTDSSERWSNDPVQAIRSALHATREFARERDAKIELVCDPSLAGRTSLVNPIELEQVFVNLIRNAIAASEGCATIRIHGSASRDAVELVVEDDGPGVPCEIGERVFEPFFTTREASGGTGLGLSLSRAIVERHGGALLLDRASAPGERPGSLSGARFVVRLPLEPESLR